MWRLYLTIVTVVSLAGSAAAETQSWPTKPIHVIVPFTAGSVSDLVPRIIFDQVSIKLHQSIVIENRVGAGSTIGEAFVAKSLPDGNTILVNSSAHTIVPSLYIHLPYDAVRDFSAIIPLGVVPLVLVISPLQGAKTVDEFIRAAKAKHGGLTFASTGVGSATHLSAERFHLSAGFEATHVPFKGVPEALTEVMQGRVDFCICALGTTLPYIQEGRLSALAIGTAHRSPILPAVPTMQESGFDNSNFTFWMGAFVSAKTPRRIIERLHEEIALAMQLPAVQEKLAKLGVKPLAMSPSEFDAYVQEEITRNASLVKTIGLKPN